MNILRRFSKQTKVVASISGVLVLAIFIFYIYPTFIFSKPLGEKLEYIGKTDYGCWIVCDSEPASVYYYGTDLTVEGVLKGFKNTSLSQRPRTFDGVTDFTLKTKNGEDISIYYYLDKDKTKEAGFSGKTDKRSTISIPSFDYDVAKNSL